MFEVDNLECVCGECCFFVGFGFWLEVGELLYLQGKNGFGKISLLCMLIGFLLLEVGEICWYGKLIRKLLEEYCVEFCYFGYQNVIKEELMLFENLFVVVCLVEEVFSEDEVIDVLEQVGLVGCEDLVCKYFL